MHWYDDDDNDDNDRNDNDKNEMQKVLHFNFSNLLLHLQFFIYFISEWRAHCQFL